MSSKLTINMGIDASDVAKGAKDAERSLEKLEDALEDTGQGGAKDLDRIEEELRDVQQAANRTAREMDDVGNGGGKSFGKIGDAAGEVTQEVGQNLGEAVSSIRGDLSDLGQVGQDTLGGLAATLASTGPAGIAGAAALAAGAVGLGLVTAEIEKQNERTQQLKQYFSEAWQAAVEGGHDYIDQATVIGEMQDIMFNPDRADEYKSIQEDANRLGLDRSTLLRAAAGDQESLNAVSHRANELVADQNKLVSDSEDIRTRGRSAKEAAAAQELDALTQINDRWREYGDINDENKQKAQDAARITSDFLLSAVDSADSATKEVDDFGNVLITLPDGEEIVIDAKTGRASSDVSKFKKDTDAVVKQLDGSQIDLIVKAALRDAQNEINGFVRANDGKSFTLHGRVKVDNGGWDS